jgi:hypothetical protein
MSETVAVKITLPKALRRQAWVAFLQRDMRFSTWVEQELLNWLDGLEGELESDKMGDVVEPGQLAAAGSGSA